MSRAHTSEQYILGRALGVCSFLLLAGLAFAGNGEESSAGTFHAGVSEVRVTFFATDDTNHPLGTIGKDDFAIIDGDMVVRNFRSLARSEEAALDVVVLVDTSESVAARLQTTMNDVVQLVSQTQTTSDDRISVMSFAGLQPLVICSRDCGGSRERLLSLKAAGATPLFDALAYGADFLSRRQMPAVRRVMILFSDGDDTISKTSASEVLQAAIDSGALIYAIDLSKTGEGSHGSAMLQQMAEATGGRYFSSRKSAANLLQAALEDLRTSYVVTYPLPSPAVGFHSLRILPKHNLNLRFHCRSGYYYRKNVP